MLKNCPKLIIYGNCRKCPGLECADLFCGAGGTTSGALQAVKAAGCPKVKLVCVNHWDKAIETHTKNHPLAEHYIQDLAVADPYVIVPRGYLDVLMASPECRFYSRARGGKPVHDQGRMNPWIVMTWITALEVKVVLIENVPEFIHWGPLLEDGRRTRNIKGNIFRLGSRRSIN